MSPVRKKKFKIPFLLDSFTRRFLIFMNRCECSFVSHDVNVSPSFGQFAWDVHVDVGPFGSDQQRLRFAQLVGLHDHLFDPAGAGQRPAREDGRPASRGGRTPLLQRPVDAQQQPRLDAARLAHAFIVRTHRSFAARRQDHTTQVDRRRNASPPFAALRPPNSQTRNSGTRCQEST